MALNDLIPRAGASGGNDRVVSYPVAVGQTFLPGEPVTLNTGGQLVVAANEPILNGAPGANVLIGIAADSALDENGVSKPVNTMLSVYKIMPGTEVGSKKLSTDVNGSAQGLIVGAMRGTLVGLMVGSIGWSFNTNAATNKTFRITDVRDAAGRPVFGAAPGVWVFATPLDSDVAGA